MAGFRYDWRHKHWRVLIVFFGKIFEALSNLDSRIIAIMLGRLRMTLAECEDVYLQLSKKIFTPRRYKHNIFGRGKDFLQANGKFDSGVLQDAIRECIREKHPEDILLKDPDLACRVYVYQVR